MSLSTAAPSNAPSVFVITSLMLDSRTGERSCTVSTLTLSAHPMAVIHSTSHHERERGDVMSHTAPNPANRSTLRAASTTSAPRSDRCRAR
jgi:hypothetical protein